MKIIEVNHSIANRYDGVIEINENLKKYPELYKPILKHELEHTDKPWSIKDFKLDFTSDTKVPQWKLLKFMFKHPRAFLQWSPILYNRERKAFVIDVNLFIMYFFMIGIFSLVLWLGGKV